MGIRKGPYASFEEIMKENHISRNIGNLLSWELAKINHQKYQDRLIEISPKWSIIRDNLFEKWKNQFDESDPIWNNPIWIYPILFEFSSAKQASQTFKLAYAEFKKPTFMQQWKLQVEYIMYMKWAELLVKNKPVDADLIVLKDKAFNPTPTASHIFDQKVHHRQKYSISSYGISTWWIAFFAYEIDLPSFSNTVSCWMMDPNTTEVSYLEKQK